MRGGRKDMRCKQRLALGQIRHLVRGVLQLRGDRSELFDGLAPLLIVRVQQRHGADRAERRDETRLQRLALARKEAPLVGRAIREHCLIEPRVLTGRRGNIMYTQVNE